MLELELIELIRRHGTSSNSFMLLYPGFKSLNLGEKGAILYVDTPTAWVGGAEPLVPQEHLPDALEEYFASASRAGKAAILLPVSAQVSQVAVQKGYGSFQVGTEPLFDLSQYPNSGKTWQSVVPAAKQAATRGGLVREIFPDSISAEEKERLDLLTRYWVKTRKTVELGFLNQVKPWFRSEFKKYFSIELEGKTLAFLAAIPVWKRNGWYLIDLIRAPSIPSGTTELLLLEAMRILKSHGAAEISTGVAPLSGLRETGSTARLLNFIYENGQWIYGFKSLFQYKLKFMPTKLDPAFMIYKVQGKRPSAIRFRDYYSIALAFFPNGIVNAWITGMSRLIFRAKPLDWAKDQISPEIVIRSTPRTWPRMIWRLRLTLALVLAQIAVFIITADSVHHLNADIEKIWGYSWENFLANPFRALALSPFLHWSWIHLASNIVATLLFVGSVELFAGAYYAAFSYAVGLTVANPITSIFNQYLVTPFINVPLNEIDVGASLGIFSCGGTLCALLKRGPTVLAALLALSGVAAYIQGSFLSLNHCFALVLGMALGKLLF